ncbi:MAG: trehalose-6-phosphate synthase, partial [Cyanobacteria bacterium J06639_1]
RDGLNLVAKEYVSAHEGKGGVLLLSEFTGASVGLPEALQVNPFADSSMDNAIDVALAMPEDEQRRRMEALNRAVNSYDVQQWANHMFREAMACEPQGVAPASSVLESEDVQSGDKDLALV